MSDVNLVGPDGRDYHVDEGNLPEALKAGYRVVTEAAPKTLGEKLAGGYQEAQDVATSTLLGGERGITGGLSDAAIQALSPESEKQAAALKEAHPIASGAGELAGMVASPLNEVAAPIEAAIAPTTALGRVGASAVGQGAVGALFGAGNTVSDAVLGDHDLTAEKLVGGIGLGSLLGAGGGAFGQGVSEVAGAVLPKASKMLGQAQQTLEEFANERWLKASGGIQSDLKKIPEVERGAVSDVMREHLSTPGKVLPKSVDEALASARADQADLSKTLLRQQGLGREVEALAPTMDRDEAQAVIDKALKENGQRMGSVLDAADKQGLRANLKGVHDRLESFLVGLNPAEQDSIAPDVKKIQGYFADLAKGNKNSFAALNDLKSTIASDISFAERGSVKAQLKKQIAGIIRDEIDTQLAPQVGSKLAKDWVDAKDAYRALSTAEDALGRKTATGADAIRSLVGEGPLTDRLSALEHATNLLKHGSDRHLGNRFVSASDYLTGIGAGVLHGGPAGVLTGLASAIGHKLVRENGAALVAKLADRISASPALMTLATSFGRTATANASHLGEYAPRILQALSQGPAKALAEHMVMAQADPGYQQASQRAGFLPETLEEHVAALGKTQQLASMGAAVVDTDKRIDRMLDGAVRGRAAAMTHGETLNAQDFGAKRMRRATPEAAKQRLQEAAAMMNNPDLMLERLSANVGHMGDMAPGVTASLASTAQRAVSYLVSSSQQPPPAGPLAHEWHASEAELHEFTSKLQVVEEPLSVLHHAAAGTLTDTQMEAIRAVYPKLAQEISNKALQRMVPGKPIPYAQRLMLYVLTDVDPDGTMGPEAIAANQAAIRAPSSKPSSGAPGSPQKSINLAQRMETPSQRLEEKES